MPLLGGAGIGWGGAVESVGAGVGLIESLSESAFRPSDDLLGVLLGSWPQEAERWDDVCTAQPTHPSFQGRLLQGDAVERWAGGRVICLWALLLHTREDAVLGRLAHLKGPLP